MLQYFVLCSIFIDLKMTVNGNLTQATVEERYKACMLLHSCGDALGSASMKCISFKESLNEFFLINFQVQKRPFQVQPLCNGYS